MTPTQKTDPSQLSDTSRSSSGSGTPGGSHPTGGSAEQIREQAKTIGRDLRDLGGIAKGAAQQQYHHGREAVADYTDQVMEQVRRSPMKSVLIAAGVGAVLAMLCRRR